MQHLLLDLGSRLELKLHIGVHFLDPLKQVLKEVLQRSMMNLFAQLWQFLEEGCLPRMVGIAFRLSMIPDPRLSTRQSHHHPRHF